MKKILLTIALTAVCAGAFAQGKIAMANDSLHLAYFGPTVKGADAALAGQKVTLAATPSGSTFLVDLFGGTSAGTMSLQQSTTFAAAIPGGWSRNFISANLAGNTTYTFQVKIREASFATAEAAQAGGGYYGFSQVFTMIPGGGIPYNSIVNPNTPAFSTWAAGNVALPGGGFGAISVEAIPVPEPSSMALAGIGAASLLMFRRRK